MKSSWEPIQQAPFIVWSKAESRDLNCYSMLFSTATPLHLPADRVHFHEFWNQRQTSSPRGGTELMQMPSDMFLSK